MPNQTTAALFVTCLVDQLFPEVGVAAVSLLRRAGCEVAFPAAQTCCGQPFYNSGFTAEAAELARQTIQVFDPFDQVVLPSGSCTAMIRHEYPRLLADDPHWLPRAEAMAAKTMELSEFLLTRELQFEPPSSAAPLPVVTYHDSCHMARFLEIREAPRQLLRTAGYALQEMEESDRCCGFGGLFSVRMPEVSNEMTAVKLQTALDSDAELIVTADSGCLQQMRGMAADPQTVVHLATLLAARLPRAVNQT